MALAWEVPAPRAVVIGVHGLSGAAEQFSPLGHALPRVSLYAVELRGQGNDSNPARRGAILDVPSQLRALDLFIEVVRRKVPGVPIFLLGESMGALLVAAHAAERPDSPVAGVIHSVPVVALKTEVPRLVRDGVRWIGRVAPQLRCPPSIFVNGRRFSPPLTRDRAYQDSLRERPHHLRVFTFRFLSELGDLIAASPDTGGRHRKPCLTLAAGKDCFVRAEQIQSWHDTLAAADKTLFVYPDAYHLLWHNWECDRVIADLRAWIDARV